MAPAGANSDFFALPHTLPLVYTLGYSPNFWDGRETRSGIFVTEGGPRLYQLTGGVVARVPGSRSSVHEFLCRPHAVTALAEATLQDGEGGCA